MSERGSSLGRYEPIPTIPEESPGSSPRRLVVGQEDNGTNASSAAGPDIRLTFVDFWPFCRNEDEEFIHLQFDRFDSLLPRANAWLRENPGIILLKCETVEKKIWSLNQLEDKYVCPVFKVPDNVDTVFYIKGLRIWFRRIGDAGRFLNMRPCQIGYRNFMPKCLESSSKYALFEDLGPMYSSLNDNLIDRPLEGPIITMETVTIRLDRMTWQGPVVEVDQTNWHMAPKQHIFFFTRIFYLFQCPAYEQVGAADFLPDITTETTHKSGLPKYTNLGFVMKKFNAWMKQVKDIRITNIQSLEAAFTGKAEKIQTNVNFLTKVDTTHLIRFIRVTYTRPKFGLPPGGLRIPRLVSQKTFVPRVLENENNKDSVILEDLSVVANRIKAWFKHVGNPIVSVEVLYHPLPLLIKRQDEGETTVLPGEWQPSAVETTHRKQSMQHSPQAQIVRVYLDGEYLEPSEDLIRNSMADPNQDTDCCRLL